MTRRYIRRKSHNSSGCLREGPPYLSSNLCQEKFTPPSFPPRGPDQVMPTYSKVHAFDLGASSVRLHASNSVLAELFLSIGTRKGFGKPRRLTWEGWARWKDGTPCLLKISQNGLRDFLVTRCVLITTNQCPSRTSETPSTSNNAQRRSSNKNTSIDKIRATNANVKITSSDIVRFMSEACCLIN